MSIADRDYMRSDFDQSEKKAKQPALYKRLLFFIWRFMRVVVKKR